MGNQTIYLAAGCFWGIEAYMKKLDGVLDTEVGYMGGVAPKPSYKQVCTGKTGHAETVRIVFDQTRLPLARLLKHFYRLHNPSSLNRQGNDIGSQYRSAIFYTNDQQLEMAKQQLVSWGQEHNRKAVTEISKAREFYPAEDYHQDYLDKNPGGYCHVDLKLADQN